MENSTLHQMLAVSDELVEALRALKLPKLGPEFKDLPSDELHAALVVHRAISKYEIPTPSAASVRKELSISEVLEADRNGWLQFDPRKLPLEQRKGFYESKEWLRNLFQGFRHTYALRFPTGEGFESSSGQTDLFYKLSQAKYWTVSPDLVQYVVEIIWRHRALRNVVRHRFRDTYGEAGVAALRKLGRVALTTMNVQQWRRKAYEFMFRACVTYNRTSRVTTVPKNNSRDRVITCESLWNMVAQLSFAHSLRVTLRSKLGINLETLQDLHRSLIRSGKATIDLSKASDRNFMCVLRALWPQHLVKWLDKMRTGIFEMDGEFYPLRMFAPMGCGCTFEVMTITLLAHTRVLDPGSTVFGDDIIIDSSKAGQLVDRLESMGWKINESKSFTEGPFRESCGGFCDLRNQRMLLSYDFVRPTNLAECYILWNKIYQLGHALHKGCQVRKLFARFYARIIIVSSRDSWLPHDNYIVNQRLLSEYTIMVPDEIVKHRRESRTRAGSHISRYWQRPVYTVRLQKTTPNTVPFKRMDSITYACFLRRGASYERPTGRDKVIGLVVEAFSGVPERNVLLATVIT